LGDHSGERRLRGLTALVEGPRAALAARLSAGLRTRDGAELATVSAEFERIGDLVAALDAAAHAARAYRGQSMSGSAYGCTARAEELARRCGGACTPALLLSATRLPFTSREREVAVLIAAGLSNRTIAARLTVSIRTVESHIYRAMAKTGAASREDLAAMLPRRQPGLDQ
jgi:DNA-binding NarL/FixJ family response regulator